MSQRNCEDWSPPPSCFSFCCHIKSWRDPLSEPKTKENSENSGCSYSYVEACFTSYRWYNLTQLVYRMDYLIGWVKFYTIYWRTPKSCILDGVAVGRNLRNKNKRLSLPTTSKSSRKRICSLKVVSHLSHNRLVVRSSLNPKVSQSSWTISRLMKYVNQSS